MLLLLECIRGVPVWLAVPGLDAAAGPAAADAVAAAALLPGTTLLTSWIEASCLWLAALGTNNRPLSFSGPLVRILQTSKKSYRTDNQALVRETKHAIRVGVATVHMQPRHSLLLGIQQHQQLLLLVLLNFAPAAGTVRKEGKYKTKEREQNRRPYI